LGIDGFAPDDPSLIQVGTDQRSSGGSTSYSAWWTTSSYGYLEQPVPYGVQPGDSMTADIHAIGGGQWSITLADSSAGWRYSLSVPYSGTGQSAEWIMEAPSVNGQPATLASYSTMAFDPGTVDGINPGLIATDAGEMTTPGPVLAQVVSSPSVPDLDTDGFNIAYGSTPPLPPLS
ncbi:MAG: G1 family glutamic endopeptidase, partial [Acidimicrobiales bacterium]